MKKLWILLVCVLFSLASLVMAQEDSGHANQPDESPVEVNGVEPAIFNDSFEVFTSRQPDLVVVNPSVSNSGLTPGEPYTIFAIARNQGTAPSAATTLRYYQSNDDVITTGDTQLGSDAIPGLNATQTSSQDLPTFAPAMGVYWVGACIDSVAGETNTANQCTSTPIQILVGADSDNDRLPDFVETNTGVYVSTTDTGSDPNNSDTDNDSIDDGDEVLGTVDGLDLPSLGTNPLRVDILFEYDWFDDNLDPGTCNAHSHQPTAGAVNRVTTAFNNSPVPNPDGSTGVNVIHDYGQGGVFTGGNLIADPNGVLGGGFNTEFHNHKAANFAANRSGYFHYVILPHRYSTNSDSSGLAELPGDDMIVSLYCFGSDRNVANTIVHEVGHNLFIRHGGFENCNWKPNYNSVMNYRYQFPGVDADCNVSGDGVLDYSMGDRNTLNEASLDENIGICNNVPVDWNDNAIIENPVAVDINTYADQVSQCGGVFSDSLQDHDDWGNIIWSGILDGDRSQTVPFTKEIIVEQPVPIDYRN